MNIGDITADIYYEIIRPKMVTSLVALAVAFALVLLVPVAITATVIRSMRGPRRDEDPVRDKIHFTSMRPSILCTRTEHARSRPFS